jgi:hypothetical protein
VARQGGERDLEVISLDEEPAAPRRQWHPGRRWWLIAGAVVLLTVLAGPVRQQLARDALRDVDRRWMTALQLRAETTNVLGELRNRVLPTDRVEVFTTPAARLAAEERGIERRLAPGRGVGAWVDGGVRKAQAAVRHDLLLAAAGRSTQVADIAVTNALDDQRRRLKMAPVANIHPPRLRSIDADLAKLSKFTDRRTGVRLLLEADRQLLVADLDNSRLVSASLDGITDGNIVGAVVRQSYIALVDQSDVAAAPLDLQGKAVHIGSAIGPVIGGAEPDGIWLSHETGSTEIDGTGHVLASITTPPCSQPTAAAGAILVLEITCVGGQSTNPLYLWDLALSRSREFGDGSLLAAGGRSVAWVPTDLTPPLEVTDVDTLQSRALSYPQAGAPVGGSISPDGQTLAVALATESKLDDQAVILIDLKSGRVTPATQLGPAASFDELAWSNDSRWLVFRATTSTAGGRFGILDRDTAHATLLRLPADVSAQAAALAVMP